MNSQLVDSIIQVILSLSTAERAVLEEKLFFDFAYPSTPDISNLALRSNSFDFLAEEPDIYTIEDGEPIPCP